MASNEILYGSATNCSNLYRITTSDAHTSGVSSCVIECESTSLSIGDTVNVYTGYVGNNGRIFSGIVKQIEKVSPEDTYTITANNVLVRAMDFFIAASNPNNPYSRKGIKAERLVKELLAMAGLTKYGRDPTNFTFGINTSVEVNLVSVYDFCKFVADTLTWHLYADNNGKVWFVDRKPYVTGSDTSDYTLPNADVLGVSKTDSERELRNRVVVYGSGVHAESKASSPYLPSGFYKSVVVATEILQTYSQCKATANYNLTLLNRLTQQVNVTLVGDHSYSARDIVTFNDSWVGASGLWYVFNIEHSWSAEGYTVTMQLRK